MRLQEPSSLMNKRFFDWIIRTGANVAHVRSLLLREVDDFDIRVTMNPGSDADLGIEGDTASSHEEYDHRVAIIVDEGIQKLLPKERKFSMEFLQQICKAVV